MNRLQDRHFEVVTKSVEETKTLAKFLSSLLTKGDLISLTGDLGAGKTCFVQGLAIGLRIKETVTSPTFNLIKEYEGRLPLYHFDVFRLESVEEMFELGYEDYFYDQGVTIIEWGDKIRPLLPAAYLEIEFRRLTKETHRKLGIYPYGEKWLKRVKIWLEKAKSESNFSISVSGENQC